MKKIIVLCMALVVLCACTLQKDYEKDLSRYNFSGFSYSYVNGNQFFAENYIYDFSKGKMTTNNKYSIKVERPECTVGAYDSYENMILYASQDKDHHDQVYIYDIESQNSTQLTTQVWGITTIIPRENDYIVVGVKDGIEELSLWSIDKKTHEEKQIKVTDPRHEREDMYVWRIAYVPQTDGIIIQAVSDSEEHELIEKSDESEEEEENIDVNIPCVHYYYHDEQLDYLFTEEMPKSMAIVSNGKKVLVEALSDTNGISDIQYDIESQEKEEMKTFCELTKALYLDDNGEYLYKFESQLVRIKIANGETETLDYDLKYLKNYDNIMLVKK